MSKNFKTRFLTGIFIPQHALPWGGKTTNKIVAKWKQRIKEQVKQRELKEASNPRFKSRGEIWKKMVTDGKLQQLANAATMFNTKQLVHLVEYALSYSGASSHFLIKGPPAVNTKIAEFQIAIKLPDGSIIWSTRTCNLDIPWWPHKMTEAHIVPGLEHLSLISTKKFCKAGCKVVFDEQECRVYKKNELVFSGGRDKKIEIW